VRSSYIASRYQFRPDPQGIIHRATSHIARYLPLRRILIARHHRGIVIERHYPSHGIIIVRYSLSRGIVIVRIIHRTVSSSRGIIHRAASRGILHRAALFIAWHIPSLLGLPLCNELDMNYLAINIECASCICKLSI
jgi:hypothetical protein